MTNTNLPCAQQDFYEVALLGWDSLNQHLAAFTAFKPKYTKTFVDDRLAELNAAIALPDEDQRDGASRTLNIELQMTATSGLANWQTLKRYISDAYAPDFVKVKCDEAGQKHYQKASQNEWSSVKTLMNDGMAFIDDNLATLTAADNMPPGFQNTFKDAKEAFGNKLQQFLDGEETNTIKAKAKNEANFQCYTRLISMFKDGQEIFKTDDATKRQFVFETVIGIVSGVDAAGFRGTVKTQEGVPVEGAIIMAVGHDGQAVSDEDGRYLYKPLPAGTYKTTFTAEGFVTKEVLMEVKTGTVSTANITLIAVPVQNPVPTP